MVPIFLLTVISDVFTIYYFIHELHIGQLGKNNAVITYALFNVYQTLPIHFVIVLASKVATNNKEMTHVVGKIINDCDDERILERVWKFELINLKPKA